MNFEEMIQALKDAEREELLRVKREYEELKLKIKEYFKSRCVQLKHQKLPQEIMELINE